MAPSRSVISADSFPRGPDFLLRLTALFDGDFSIDWLEDLTNMKASEILGALEEQVQQQRLERKRPGVYFFTDAQKQLELSNAFPQDLRERCNAQIASVLVRELPDNDSKPIAVAYHLLQVSNGWKGCQWLVRAADTFTRLSKTEMGVKCFQKVLSDLSDQPGGEEDLLFVKAAIGYSASAATRSNPSVLLSWLQKAQERVKQLGNQPYEVLLELHMAKSEWFSKEYDKSLRRFNHALKMVETLQDRELTSSAATFNTYFLFWQGRFNEIIKNYEASVPDVEKYPIGYLSLVAAMMVGHSYVMVDKATQGLGLLSTIRDYCVESGDRYMAALVKSVIGMALLSINQLDDAYSYLEDSVKEAKGSDNKTAELGSTLLLAFLYWAKSDQSQCIRHLKVFLKHRTETAYSNSLAPLYLLQLCWMIEIGQLPAVPGLSFQDALDRMADTKSIFTRGIICRYQALLGKAKGWSNDRIGRSLALSVKHLGESGNRIEQAKTQVELARLYLSQGNEAKGKEALETVRETISATNSELIPDDLQKLITTPDQTPVLRGVLETEKDIAELIKEMSKTSSERKLTQHIVAVVNRVTGAERGALLLIDNVKDDLPFVVNASRNLTEEQINHPSFEPCRAFIENVIDAGEGGILDIQTEDNASPVRSAICVPLNFDKRTIGVLYHDNRLIRNVFNNSDLNLLSYFAALAVLHLDAAMAHREIIRIRQKQKEEEFIQEALRTQRPALEGTVGSSPAMQRIWSQVDEVAKTDTTVLLLGETGTGKNKVAGIIHQQSARSNRPFITVQCSALTESLITSELFGHEKGAFTGATSRQIGRFEMADGGTLFLDEIGDLSLDVQARLLRVLQTREFERVGGGKQVLTSDFRLIAATNRDLRKDVQAKRFREDLYYRINVYPIVVPPVRERREDIPQLVYHFLKIFGSKYGKSFKIRQEVMDQLVRYEWPGNVRELENVVQRGVISSRGKIFRLPNLAPTSESTEETDSFATLEENERRHITKALRRTGWKLHGPGGAAELLDINPSTLASRIKKLQIKKPPRGTPKIPEDQ